MQTRGTISIPFLLYPWDRGGGRHAEICVLWPLFLPSGNPEWKPSLIFQLQYFTYYCISAYLCLCFESVTTTKDL